MAKLEDDLKIKVKVASPEIRVSTTIMNSMVFKDIIHNDTLIGDGNKEPLGIAPEILSDISTAKSDIEGLKTDLSTTDANIAEIDEKFENYLPLSGGTLTGQLGINSKGYIDHPILVDAYDELQIGYQSPITNSFIRVFRFTLGNGTFLPYANKVATLGNSTRIWKTVYATKLNNGADLVIPTEGGTIARVEDIPTLLSQLTNDLGFATSAEVQALIASLPKYRVEKVSVLPETGEELVLYLVPKDGSTNDVYDEYIWEDGSYELLGTTQVDLSGYLPLAGGEMTGNILMANNGCIVFGGTIQPTTDPFAPRIGWKSQNVLQIGDNTLLFSTAYHCLMGDSDGIRSLGRDNVRWQNVYTKKLNNGADIDIPTTGGTLARVEDIDAIGGDGTTGQVLTKTADGMAWQDASGGDYLPLSGGTLEPQAAIGFVGYTGGQVRTLSVSSLNVLAAPNGFQCGNLYPKTPKNTDIGDSIYSWRTIYVAKMNNGADLIVPESGGTIARIEDINAVVGDISTALTAILGE